MPVPQEPEGAPRCHVLLPTRACSRIYSASDSSRVDLFRGVLRLLLASACSRGYSDLPRTDSDLPRVIFSFQPVIPSPIY